MASMWKRRLAAMLMVGRKTKELRVGRRSLATSEPMGASWASSSRGLDLCELGSQGGESSSGERALKFKCPAWQEGCGQGTAATAAPSLRPPRILDTAGGSGQQMLCGPKILLGVSKGVKGNVVLARLVLGVGFGDTVGEDSGFARSSTPESTAPVLSLAQCCWSSPAGKIHLLSSQSGGEGTDLSSLEATEGPGTVLCRVRS